MAASNSPRKLIKARRGLPSPSPDNTRLKSVTFSDEIIETSIGGTRRLGKIRQDVLLHFDAPVTTNGVTAKWTPSQAPNRTPSTTKSSGGKLSVTTVMGKENKEVTTPKTSSSSSESSSEETCSMRLNVNNNNSSYTRHKPSRSPVSKSKSDKNKKPLNEQATSQNEASSSVVINKSTEISLTDLLISNNAEATESPESVKRICDVSEDRRTTMERIERIAQSQFRTPNSKESRRHTLESKIFATPDCYREVNFGSPRGMLPMIQDESVDMSDEGKDSCSIMVAVRVRPFGQRELSDPITRCAVSMRGNETAVTSDNGNAHRFTYDFSFWSHSRDAGDFCDQESVYVRLAQPLLVKAFEGYNTCLFAYGQTGSGKSFSIMGHTSEPGIIPRFCEELFSRAEILTVKKKVKINVEISFFEIYNEKIHDLLASSKDKGVKKTTLKVREHPVLGPYVEGLSTYVVNSFDDVEGWITLGNKNRATASTGMNDKSSRSHSVFTIVLTQTKTENIEGQEHDHSVNSKINLVDLAGSERQSMANTSGERLREGANINKSLLTLGKVISILSERSVTKKRKIFIPYRDSVLTWLLKESLGGNSKTAMIATISPASQHIEETLSTLRYAQQARSIVNVVHINEDPKAKIIRQLKAEIERLRAEQGGLMTESALAASMTEIAKLKSEMEELSRSWQERLRQAEARKAEELHLLEKAGITCKVDNRLPNLVNLNEDPQLSEMLLYVIKEGETRVGRKMNQSQHDIELTGALIADHHCVINSSKGVVELIPMEDAPTYVNGNLITQATVLHHGDRVILGGDHYFRFNHPIEVQKSKSEGRGSSDMKDFDFAKQELHHVQEARLQAELEEELEKTKKELTQQKDGYEIKLKGLETVLTQVEKTHKQAQSTIHDLKKQNMMLEQEVLAGRKRQKLEHAQQVLGDLSSTESKIVELLEAETKQVSERLEKFRRNRLEMAVPSCLASTPHKTGLAHLAKTGSPGSRRDLYKVALLLREANKINQYLNTSLVFSREDVPDGDKGDMLHTQICVTNTRHRMFTLWTVAKFEEKLAQMRDLYQNEEDVSIDDDEVFNDPNDVWEKELSTSSPAGLWNGRKTTSRAIGPVKTTPELSLRTESSVLYSPRSSLNVEMSLVRACKSLLSSVGNSLTALCFEESVIDKVLSTCQRIQDCTIAVLETDSKKSVGLNNTSWARPMLQLVADVHLLASHTTLWLSFYAGLESTFLRDLLARSTNQVKIIGHQANSLLQGCESKLISLKSESGHKLLATVMSLCETCGELALAIDSQILRLDQSSRDYSHTQLSPGVSANFLNGCNKFTSHTLERGLVALEKCEQKCSSLTQAAGIDPTSDEMPQRLTHVLSCIRGLLQKTLSVQEELGQERLNSDDHTHPSQYYSSTYKRLQGTVSSVYSIIDSSTLLIESAEPLVKGMNQDGKRLEQCAELLQKSCQKLLLASSYTYMQSSSLLSSQQEKNSLTSTLSVSSSLSSVSSQSDVSTSVTESTVSTSNETTNVSALTDVTLLSESQLGQLDSATQEVTMAAALFIEYIHKNWSSSSENSLATPQGKRLLHSSTKSVVTPAVSAAYLKRLNTKQMIALASKD